MIQIPWSCVTALKLAPVGPIKAEVFGLRHTEGNTFHVQEPRRLVQLRDALGQFVHDPRVNQVPFKMERHPFYQALCNIHLALTEAR